MTTNGQEHRMTATPEVLSTLRSMRDPSGPLHSTGHYEIAPAVVHSTGAMWVFFDHARFVIHPDGTFGSQRYGAVRLYGLKVDEVKRPVAPLAVAA